MQNVRILILSAGKLFGPFPDQGTTETWLENHDSIKENCELYSVWDTELGTDKIAHECGTRLPSIEEATKADTKRHKGAGAAMLLGLSLVAALAVAPAAKASCCIPPRHPIVVTSCGKVEAVYVTTKTGFTRYDGPIAVRYAQYVPLNQRIDSGCKR